MIQEADLNRLRTTYAIHDEFRMIVLDPEDRVVSPTPGCVAFYKDTFEAGLRFPLHHFITNILDFYTVTLTQFTPNGFRIIVSFMPIYDICKVEPRLVSFRAIFMLKAYPYNKDWYHFIHTQNCKVMKGILSAIYG